MAMTANSLEQETLFPLPEAEYREPTLEERMEEFTRVAKGKGGLIPVTAAGDLLGINRSRVYQLIDSGRLERIHYCGVAFITGRSIKDWRESDKARTGRGNKKIGTWESIVIGAKIGIGVGAAITSE